MEISDDSITATMNVVFLRGDYDQRTLATDLVGVTGQGTYPAVSFLYIILRTSAWENDCEKLTQFLDWIVWIQTYSESVPFLLLLLL